MTPRDGRPMLPITDAFAIAMCIQASTWCFMEREPTSSSISLCGLVQDASAIRIVLSGAEGLAVDRDGDLVAEAGKFRLRKPAVYQDEDGKRTSIQAAYRLLPGTHEVQLKLGAYDAKRALV